MSEPLPRRGFGLVTLTGIVIANMVGAGVFTTSGFALGDLHTPGRVILAWVVAGGLAACGAIAYGALAKRLQESGGEYLYLTRWVHPAAGYLAGWVSLLAGFTGAIAFAALALETYLWPAGGWVAVSAILACAVLHGARRAPGAWLQNGMVAIKMILLVVFIAVGAVQLGVPASAPVVSTAPVPPFALGAFAVSLMWISLSYAGFNAAIYVAGEARDARQVPRALFWGTLITLVAYVALNTVFVLADPEAVKGQPDVAAVAARALGGSLLEQVTRVVIPLALFTSVSAMMLAGPRVYAQMAADGWLPGWMRFSPNEDEAPRGAIAFQAVLAIGLVWVASLRELLGYLGFVLSLSSAGAVASLWVLHRTGRVQLAWWQVAAGSFYVAMTLAVACVGAWLNPRQGVAGLGTLLLGYAMYRLIRHRQFWGETPKAPSLS